MGSDSWTPQNGPIEDDTIKERSPKKLKIGTVRKTCSKDKEGPIPVFGEGMNEPYQQRQGPVLRIKDVFVIKMYVSCRWKSSVRLPAKKK